MGNTLRCFSAQSSATAETASPRQPWKSPFLGSASSRLRRSRSSRKKKNQGLDDLRGAGDDEALADLQQQAMAAALLFQEYRRSGGSAAALMMNRSASVVHPSPASAPASKAKQGLPRSSSSRQRLGSDAIVQPQELINSQDSKSIEGLETNHFVLVHGGGFGAWCWYKTMTLLEEAGFRVDAVDLTGSGVSSSDANSVVSLAQHVKPLTDMLEKLSHGKKVILVGHDFGGACISYAMEIFPSRIAKAVFVAATMLASGQSTLDLFSRQTGQDDLMHQAQIFLYANGKNQAPTAIDHNKELVKDLFFNQSPSKDVALASLSMRPVPFAPVMEKLSFSDPNYGSIRRFYVMTQEDRAITTSLQETMVCSNPPEQVFRIKGSDHSPFFSRPQALHKILLEIAQIPPK